MENNLENALNFIADADSQYHGTAWAENTKVLAERLVCYAASVHTAPKLVLPSEEDMNESYKAAAFNATFATAWRSYENKLKALNPHITE